VIDRWVEREREGEREREEREREKSVKEEGKFISDLPTLNLR